MKTVLKIDASMRRQGSQTRKLLNRLLEELKGEQPLNVLSRDLADGVPLIDDPWIEANFTDPSERTAAQRAVLAHSDDAVNELRDADVIVVGVPIYNFHVPAAFKAWIDLVARARETFRYTPDGPEGLLKNKKAYVVISSGGTKLGSAIDFVSPYIRHIFGFIGIDDVVIIDGSGGNTDQAEDQIKNLDTSHVS